MSTNYSIYNQCKYVEPKNINAYGITLSEQNKKRPQRSINTLRRENNQQSHCSKLSTDKNRWV